MADKQDFATLPPRQKTIVIVILMVAIFAVWEVIGMFRGGKNASTIIAPSQQAIAATVPTPKPPLPQSPPPVVQQVAGPAPTTKPPQPSQPPLTKPRTLEQSHPQVDSTPPSSIVLVQQEQVQSKYVTALNQLQMLKIQKEIAETSQAIVAAKLATASAEKSITDLLSEPEIGKPGPGGPNIGPSSTNVMPPSQPPLGAPSEAPGAYSVKSVSMEQDQWHAVVKFKDRLYNVSIGDMLPPDKSLVKTIDQKGVTLDTGGMEQRIPLTVTDNVTPPASGSGGAPESSQ